MSLPPEDTVQSAPLVEFLNTLPSPLTTTLVALAPVIARTRHALQLVSWKGSWEECWLLLAAWWAVCLIPEIGLRYILPFAVFLLFFRSRGHSKPPVTPPITEDTLQRAIADLTTIHALLPPLPALTSSLPLTATIAVFAKVYPAYVTLTYLIPLRILLALTGTLFLTYQARWAAILRAAFWRSSYFRWGVYRAWSLLSGEPLPPITLSPQSQSDAQLASLSSSSSAAATTPPNTSVRFLFTIYENQRWWMGLDWTAALLPGERPSWCSVSQQPAAPPSAFTLPAATTVFTLAPDGKRRVRRVARWTWEEHEWRVVVRREGGAGTSRVVRALPSPKEESAAAASATRILRAAGKMRAPSVDVGEKRAEEEGAEHAHAQDAGDGKGRHASDGEEDEEPLTDVDGWVYADNKWEGASCKGGMGKYTRFRRWTRIAVLTESVEIVEAGELGLQRDEPIPDVHHQPEPAPATVSPAVTESTALASATGNSQAQLPAGTHSRTASDASVSSPVATSRSSIEEEASRLKQRLKAAVMGATGHA